VALFVVAFSLCHSSPSFADYDLRSLNEARINSVTSDQWVWQRALPRVEPSASFNTTANNDSTADPPREAAQPTLPTSEEEPIDASVEKSSEHARDAIVDYLWNVYQRSPTKQDSHGDFTWKDQIAAERLGLSVQDYVISGMDPDFRELLYHAGLAMDSAGVQWTILSGFRDDYRQTIATGFKARPGASLHGGSIATGGYGHGCAADLGSADGISNSHVWDWLRVHAVQFGLQQPLPSIDPAHVQPRGEWRELAAAARLEHTAQEFSRMGGSSSNNAGESTRTAIMSGQPNVSLEVGCTHARLSIPQSAKASGPAPTTSSSSASLPDSTPMSMSSAPKTAAALTRNALEPIWFVQLAGGVTEAAALAAFDRIQNKYDRVLGAYRPLVMRATGAGYRWYCDGGSFDGE
jgi:hypothetical protein